MLLTILISSLFSLSVTWVILDRRYDFGTEIGAILTTAVFSIALLIMIIMLLVGKPSTRADIRQFEAAKLTIEQQRASKTLTEYERVQLTIKIVDKNTWLAGEQFWAANPWLNWFYDKSILEVKPIE